MTSAFQRILRWAWRNKVRVLLPLLLALLALNVLAAREVLPRLETSRTAHVEISRIDFSLNRSLPYVDTDGDGLPDLDEIFRIGTDPTLPDTDGDGIPDSVEARFRRLDSSHESYCPDPTLPDSSRDCSGKGLTLGENYGWGRRLGLDPNLTALDPWVVDTDGDGLPDSWEVHYAQRMANGTICPNPLVLDAGVDCIGKGLSNLENYRLGLDPTKKDSDGDGLDDLEEERTTQTDPTRFSTSGSGIADGWLVAFGLNTSDPAIATRSLDSFLTVREKFEWSAKNLRFFNGTTPPSLALFKRGLDPRVADTDGDGIPDSFEIRHGLNPLDPTDGGGIRSELIARAKLPSFLLGRPLPEFRLSPSTDPDSDGLTNFEEFLFGSDPHLRDTDGDGLSDFEEVVVGWEVTVQGTPRRVFSDPSRSHTDGSDSGGGVGFTDLEKKQGWAFIQGRRVDFCFDRETNQSRSCSLDPTTPDTDLDGLPDYVEVTLKLFPPLDPTDPDTDHDGLKDGEEFSYWNDRASQATPDELSRLIDQHFRCTGRRWTIAEARSSLLPGGHVGEGCGRSPSLPNIVNPDSDGDGIPDGREVHPERRATFPGSEDQKPFPPSDPAFFDTDGDGLDDGWEATHAYWNYSCGGWDLDPSKRDSLGACLSDGKDDSTRDLDNDGVHYKGGYSFPIDYFFTNRDEYVVGTDPHLSDTDGDGVPDGWEYFFSSVGGEAPLARPCSCMSPLRGGDVNETYKTYTYTRINWTLQGSPPTLVGDEVVSFSYSNVRSPHVPREITVWGIRGTLRWSLREIYENQTDPLLSDTDGDGLPDIYEVLIQKWIRSRSDVVGCLSQFNPHDGGKGAGLDCDGDGLTNLQEFGIGTSPLDPDTDMGGLSDSEEAPEGILGANNPLDPLDDLGPSDSDCDGLTARSEREIGTSVVLPDTDGDGLLDGPDWDSSSGRLPPSCDLTAGHPTVESLVEEFLRLGIVHLPTPGGFLFLGEGCAEGSACSSRSNPTLYDTDGDGIPDGWERFYGYDPTQDTGGIVRFGDLTEAQRYSVGKPDGWVGTWWLSAAGNRTSTTPGLRRCTVGPPFKDGILNPKTGKFVGNDFDYDKDGLNDFIGEDPYPFFDHENRGKNSPENTSFVDFWVFREGRMGVGALDSTGSGCSDFENLADVRIRVDEIIYDSGTPDILPKGGSLRIRGALLPASGVTRWEGRGGVTVVANLAFPDATKEHESPRADPSEIVGVAVTRADGTFELNVSLVKNHRYTLPPDAPPTVVLGKIRQPGEAVEWTLQTETIPVSSTIPSYKILLWSYGVGVFENKTRAEVWDSSGRLLYVAHGLRNTFFTPVVATNTVRITSPVSFRTPPSILTTPGGTITGKVVLVDGSQDPVPERPVVATWNGVEVRGTTDSSGEFRFTFETGSPPAPGYYSVNVTTPPSDVWGGAESRVPVIVAFPTRLSGRILNPDFVVAAGGALLVEGKLLDYRQAPIPDKDVGVRFLDNTTFFRTDSSGMFRGSIAVPNETEPGNQAVVLVFGGGELHAPSEEPLGFVVVRARSVLSIVPYQPEGRELRSVDVIDLKKDLVIQGSLRDSLGRPIHDPTEKGALRVTVEAGGFRAVATVDNSTGGFSVVVPRSAYPLPLLLHLRATFAGTSAFAPVRVESVVPVSAGTLLDLPSQNLTRGKIHRIVGSLKDELGRGVAGEIVALRFENGTWRSARTDPQGAFTLTVSIPSNSLLGPTVVQAYFNGSSDGLLRPAPVVTSFLRIQSETRLVVENTSLPRGVVTIRSRLLDDRGAPVGGENLRILFQGRPLPSSPTDSTGTSESTLDASTLPAARYEIRGIYPGSIRFAPSEGLGVLTLKIQTTIVPDPIEVVARGSSLELHGRIFEEGGAPFSGASIEAILNETTVAHGTSKRDGSFALVGTVPPTFPRSADAVLTFRFRGDEFHVGSEAFLRVRVIGTTTLRLVLPDRVESGSAFSGVVQLVDDEGRGVPHAVIRVNFSGFYTPFTLRTNETGYAVFPGKVTGTGTNEVNVRFVGSENLLPSESFKTLTVAPTFLGGGGVAWVLAVLAALAVGVLLVVLVGWYRIERIREIRRILQSAEHALIVGDEYTAAILLAYRRLREHLEKFGYIPTSDVSAREFAVAIKEALPVRPEPLDELVTLFEEARYSAHVLGPLERERALAALAEIRKDLVRIGGPRGVAA